MLLRVTEVSAQLEMHVILLAVEADLQRSLLTVAEVSGDHLYFVVVTCAGLDLYPQPVLTGEQSDCARFVRLGAKQHEMLLAYAFQQMGVEEFVVAPD